MKERERLPYLLISPCFMFLILVILYPTLYNIYISLFDKRLGMMSALRYVGLWNYVNIFRAALFYKILQNSVVWTVGSLVPQLLIGLLVAVVLNQRLMFARVARSIIILPWVVPGVVAASVWRLIFHADFGVLNDLLFRIGLINSYQAWLGRSETAMMAVVIANVWKGMPFYVILFYAGLQAIPAQLYEVAMIDGANMWQKFVYITMPQLKSVIVVSTILAFVWNWGYFDLIWVMTQGGPIYATETVPVLIYSTAFRYQKVSEAAAVSFLLFLIFFVAISLRVTVQRRNR